MRVTIWKGCVVKEEIELPVEGPNVDFDPYSKCGYVEVNGETHLFDWKWNNGNVSQDSNTI